MINPSQRFLKKYWRKWNVRHTSASNAFALDRLYFLEDPWGLDTSVEHFRFRETARLIGHKIGTHFGSILEIGCGEGLQTKYLALLADEVIGLDPSTRATKRARARKIVNASFEVGDLMSYAPRFERTFDLVTACEVLYYVQDLDLAYAKLSNLGRNCVVTYYQGAFEQLDKYFAEKPVSFETIRGASCEWRVVAWESVT